MSEQAQIPPGYMENSQGALIPKSKIKEIDLKRTKMVETLFKRAQKAQKVMSEFKAFAMSEVSAFVESSAEEYNKKMGGEKGNVTLITFNGNIKIERSVSDYIVFDERLQVAKTIIDECLNEWSKGSNKNIKAVIHQAFKTDSEGRVSTSRIIALRGLDIDDPKWQEAMQAITDSMQVASTTQYLRIYLRDEKGQYQPFPLNITAL